MRTYFVSLAALAAAVIAFSMWRAQRAEPRAQHADEKAGTYASYASSVQPIFDRRCVPCHACYDSPCQLTLQSFEGFDRGANRDLVYYPERALTAKPTRMFQDAQTTARWQSDFGFFPVATREQPNTLARSMLWRYLSQRADYERGKDFDVDATTTCPRDMTELEAELHEKPERGMPFGFPALTSNERNVLGEWLRNGAGGYSLDHDESEHGALAEQVAKWEAFFDQSDPKRPLVSAYLFEHLFYAHLQFEAAPGSWFRLVRSRTPPGTPIDEIATRRPYDDPGTEHFYYRLRRIRETLVLKTHVPYLLSDMKLDRLTALFYRSTWTPPPSAAPFDPKVAANPFIAFAPIPARARYQFMLDDARYHVQVFIHGPVCRGQAALDVIEEQFLIFFLAPDNDPSIDDPAYLASVADELSLPAEHGGTIAALSPGFDAREIRYLGQQSARVRARGRADIWNGDGTNADAVLTVFRHYDNAFVVRGALAGMPKTAWVVDYPI
ncbi:MAG TPA: fatty acid cis/trans isomerase, partial [Polyangiales bacterium]